MQYRKDYLLPVSLFFCVKQSIIHNITVKNLNTAVHT